MPLQVKDGQAPEDAELCTYPTGSLVRITTTGPKPVGHADVQLLGTVVMIDTEGAAMVLVGNQSRQQGWRLDNDDMNGLRGVEVNATMEVH